MQFTRLLAVVLSATAILFATNVVASDAIYRWANGNGVVHFGDRPDTQKQLGKSSSVSMSPAKPTSLETCHQLSWSH